MASADRVEIRGSDRAGDQRHRRVGDADGGKQINVTVYLRPSASFDWVDGEAGRAPAERRPLTRAELAGSHGARDEDVAAVRSFARDYGLEVTGVDKGRRAASLRGTVDAVAKAFGVEALGLFEHPSAGVYRGRLGPLTVPQAVGEVITGVFGIDERPQAIPHFRRSDQPAAATSYSPTEVAAAYSFPTGVNGSGETAGIIELGGGYSQTDLNTYFASLGITPPSVIAVSVDGGTNSPGQSADGEVMLDIEVLGAVAPGARMVVYFAPNTDQGFLDAVSTAVHDSTNKPSVVSISWGGPEDSWTEQARSQMEQILTEAAALGVTVTVASGDGGSTDGVNDGKQHVDFPASAPHALACGGTSLQITGGQITSEVVWNDLPNGGAGGGGISVEFTPPPSYQSAITQTNVDTGGQGRGVPDVAGNADPATGYSVLVDGQQQTVGGTSAVAPLWAGLIALINQSLGKPVGFLQPQLYSSAAAAGFHDIIVGDNPAYQAGTGWDACTGNGSPIGTGLLGILGGQAPAATGT
ncbi:MAG: protease pro-enzyme activation domain-containing protein [Solirubrobacteraceae bacterium]